LKGLQDLSSKHEVIGDVRGSGLYLGLEFVEDKTTRKHAQATAVKAMNGLRERGILGGTAGKYGNVWKIRPPLCFRREHADMLIEGLDAVLSAEA
jgi:4-aminobutyrate aminotransferase-like enzyme